MGQIVVLDEAGKPKQEEHPKELVSENKVSSPVVQELQIEAVADVLSLEKAEKNLYSEEIDMLLDYARSVSSDHSLDGLKWAIRDLEIKLGSTPLSEKKISYLSRYAYLLTQKTRTEQELKKFDFKQ